MYHKNVSLNLQQEYSCVFVVLYSGGIRQCNFVIGELVSC